MEVLGSTNLCTYHVYVQNNFDMEFHLFVCTVCVGVFFILLSFFGKGVLLRKKETCVHLRSWSPTDDCIKF